MEKYRKFADEKNGINPFINAPRLKKRSLLLNILRFPFIVVGVVKFAIFAILFIIYFVLQTLLSLLGLTSLIDTVFSYTFLVLFGVYSFEKDNQTVSTEKQIRREINNSKSTIVLSSQSTIIDWFVLIYKYSPIFLQIVKNTQGKDDLLVKLSYADLISYASGIKIPYYSTDEEANKYDNIDLTKLTNHTLVIFPECSKTTREASLNIRSNIMDTIYSEFIKGRINLYSDISIYKYTYFYPNNTTDRRGIRNIFNLLCQVYNKVKIQTNRLNPINFDVENVDRQLVQRYKNKNYYYDSLIQENLTNTEFRNNTVTLNCLDHLKFLDFFEETATSTEYVKKKDN